MKLSILEKCVFMVVCVCVSQQEKSEREKSKQTEDRLQKSERGSKLQINQLQIQSKTQCTPFLGLTQ